METRFGFVILALLALGSIGCGGRGNNAPANVHSVWEKSVNAAGDKVVEPLQTLPDVTSDPNNTQKVTSITWNRAYGLQDNFKGPINIQGVKIYEVVYVHVNNSTMKNEDFKVNSTTTNKSGIYGDSPSVANPAGLEDALDVQITKIMYTKTADGKKILGANYYSYKRDAGDGAKAVREKSKMDPIYYPATFDPPVGKAAPIATFDSGN